MNAMFEAITFLPTAPGSSLLYCASYQPAWVGVLSESLGLSVIAEGVKLQAQAKLLAHLGFHAYQGYWSAGRCRWGRLSPCCAGRRIKGEACRFAIPLLAVRQNWATPCG